MTRYINANVEIIKAGTAAKILDRATDKAVCKEVGDGSERLFISIPELRDIVREVLGDG